MKNITRIIGLPIISIVFSVLFIICIVNAAHNIVKTSTRYGQILNTDIAMNQNGDSVVVWQDKGGKSYEIYSQTFELSGRPTSFPERVNHFRPNDQTYPSVAMNSSGDYVIVWQSYGQDGSGNGIYGRRYEAGNDIKYKTFKVNTYIIDDQIKPVVTMNDNGNFVVAWVGEKSINGQRRKAIFAQRFDSLAEPIDGEIDVSQNTATFHDNPNIAMDKNGNFIIVWQAKNSNDYNIYGQVFNSNGKPVSDNDILINKTTYLNQTNPQVALVNSKFMVIWENMCEHEILDLMQENIMGQIITSAGSKSGTEFQVSESIIGHQKNPDLVQISSSQVRIVWEGYKKYSEKFWAIYSKLITLTGASAGDEEMINEVSKKWNKYPAIASNGKGDNSIVWVGLNGKQYKKAIYLEINLKETGGFFNGF